MLVAGKWFAHAASPALVLLGVLRPFPFAYTFSMDGSRLLGVTVKPVAATFALVASRLWHNRGRLLVRRAGPGIHVHQAREGTRMARKPS